MQIRVWVWSSLKCPPFPSALDCNIPLDLCKFSGNSFHNGLLLRGLKICKPCFVNCDLRDFSSRENFASCGVQLCPVFGRPKADKRKKAAESSRELLERTPTKPRSSGELLRFVFLFVGFCVCRCLPCMRKGAYSFSLFGEPWLRILLVHCNGACPEELGFPSATVQKGILRQTVIFRGEKTPKIKNSSEQNFDEQFPLGSGLASQGRRQKFAQIFRKSSCKRGVFFDNSGFGVGFWASNF